jgi:hypothetical protein
MRKLVILCLAVGLAGASNFYIFYKQVGANPNCPGLSIDAYNNAPSHREWQMDSAGDFSEDNTNGDWLIRAVLDWTPQDTNASVVWFGTNMPTDTVPNINLGIRAWVKNMGSAALPVGTPVRLSISGPSSYVYNDTAATVSALNHGATSMVNFTPAWHIPNVPGDYHIKVWTEAAGEMWPADDTVSYDLNCMKWIQYHTDANLHWLTWAAPERAVKFNPADFGLSYPFGISRVKADFYLHDTIPWPDTSFTFKIYGGDGQTLLYESDTLEALPGTPGLYRACDLDSMLVIPSGTFYVAVAPVSSTAFHRSAPTVPSSETTATTAARAHGLYGLRVPGCTATSSSRLRCRTVSVWRAVSSGSGGARIRTMPFLTGRLRCRAASVWRAACSGSGGAGISTTPFPTRSPESSPSRRCCSPV